MAIRNPFRKIAKDKSLRRDQTDSTLPFFVYNRRNGEVVGTGSLAGCNMYVSVHNNSNLVVLPNN